jgi:transcription antitermination factor NusG
MNMLQIAETTMGRALPVAAEWYALQTRPRHEKKVASELAQRGVNAFLPLVTETRQWSDRRMKVELPLFSGYLFVNIEATAESRVCVLRIPGVLHFVGNGQGSIPVPESQIEDVRRLLASKVPFVAHRFLEIGQRVRVRGGALDGIEGILDRYQGKDRLVISVQTIQRALCVNVEGYQVEPVGGAAYA